MAVRDIKLTPGSAIAKQVLAFPLSGSNIINTQTDKLFAAFAPGHEFLLDDVQVSCGDETGAVSFSVLVLNRDGIISAADATLGIHSTPAQFVTGAAVVARIGNTIFRKAATTGLTFSQAFTVADDKFGVSLVQMNASGTISTKEPAAAMAYDSATLAAGNVPAPDAGNIALGYIVIAPTAGTFTANTTALTGIATYVDTAPITPAVSALAAADNSLAAAPAIAFDAGHGNPDALLVVLYTADGTGDIDNGALFVTYRPFPLNGEVSQVTD